MNPQLPSWEDLLQRVYAFRNSPPPAVSLQDLVSMATGHKPVPDHLDPDTLDLLETVTAWEQYDWHEEKTENPFDILVCWVQKQVQVVMSSLTWQPAVLPGVRSGNGGEVSGLQAMTESGASVLIAPGLHRGAQLKVTFSGKSGIPDRVDLKKDGILLESLPRDEGTFLFELPEPGIYALELCWPHRTSGFLALSLEPPENTGS